MSHQEKQRIFDEYAVNKGFKSWQKLLHKAPVNELPNHTFAACDLVQAEQQKRIAENAELGWVKCDDCNCTSDQSEFRCPENIGIQKASIINPENLIK